MNASRHLTEAERQDLADGTMPAEQLADVTEHLGRCDECATDVARIKQLMTRIRETPPPQPIDPGADLWPEIRSRIERDKIVQLPATDREAIRRPAAGGLRKWLIAGNLAAAAVIVFAVFRVAANRPEAVAPTPNVPNMTLVADSVRAYEQEATFLLNELEMRRAMMRPQTRAAVDHDLDVIDKAIAELKEAIARDPKNAALRQLLASSYKQKVELLKRATSAG